jgi:WD40 repeat protein
VRTLYGHRGTVWSVAYSPDGTQIVSSSDDGTIKIWNAIKDYEKTVIAYAHPNQPIRAVSFNCDGTQVASGADDNLVQIWDTKSWKLLFQLVGHSAPITSVSYSPDGKRLISASKDMSIRMWRMDADPPAVFKVISQHSDCINSIAYSPDGHYFASCSSDKTIKVGDAETGNIIETLKGHSLAVNSICYALDGEQLVSGSSDKTIRVWDLYNKKTLLELKGHEAPVTCVSVSPDGRQLVSGDESGNIILWDKEEGRQLLSMKNHLGCVTDVVFSADSKRIFSCSSDDTICIWSPDTDKCVLTVGPLNQGGFQSIALSPDEKTIVAAAHWFGNMIIVSSHSFEQYDQIKNDLLRQRNRYLLEITALKVNPNKFSSQAKTFAGHHYFLVGDNMIWKEAKEFSESVGGHLATITSREENDWIVKTFPELDYWLGGIDEQSKDKWKWITGEDWEYSNWYPGKPNYLDGGRNVLHMYKMGKWDDGSETATRYFLIEWDR